MQIRRSEVLFGLAALVGCLPPDEPQKPKATVDPDIATLSHAWKVAGHVLTTKTSMSDRDATDLHGRAIAIGSGNYQTPWHGTCEEANREKRTRSLVDITPELDLPNAANSVVRDFGLSDPMLEFRFSCTANKRAPPLTLFVSNARAMTCFGGVCYLLKRD